MIHINKLFMVILLIVVALCGCGCSMRSDKDDLQARDTDPAIEIRTESEPYDRLSTSMLEAYADRFTWEELETMCCQIELALQSYASDFEVSADTLPAAQEYVAAYIQHKWALFKPLQMVAVEYTLDFPEPIHDGYDFAIAFRDDYYARTILIYLGKQNCYLEVDGEPEYAYCPATVNKPSANNQSASLEACIATGEAAIAALTEESGNDDGLYAGLFSVLYPEISKQDVFPRFVSARYDEGLSAKNVPGYVVDSGVLYITDADGNEYGFRMSSFDQEILYNGTTIYYRRHMS